MALSLKHKFVNPKADGADATITRPSNWNDEHDLLLSATSLIVGRITAAAGAAEELTAANVKTILGFPNTTVDNTIPRFDGTAGNLQTSGIVVNDSDQITTQLKVLVLDKSFDFGHAATSRAYGEFHNDLGTMRIGVESSTGGNLVTSGSAYASVIGASSAHSTHLIAGNTIVLTLTSASVIVKPLTATPAAGSTAARLLFGTTANFGIYYGSGAPTVSAAQGSIYLRSDGSSTSTRLYVNTNGSTTWTNVTTAA